MDDQKDITRHIHVLFGIVYYR